MVLDGPDDVETEVVRQQREPVLLVGEVRQGLGGQGAAGGVGTGGARCRDERACRQELGGDGDTELGAVDAALRDVGAPTRATPGVPQAAHLSPRYTSRG